MQFHFPVTPLTWIKVGAQEKICKNSSMQTSEGQGHARFTTLWVPNSFWSLYNMSENSSRINHASRILDSRCKGQRTTAMRYQPSLIKLPDIYQPEYRPRRWQGKKKFRYSFSENHCWWTQSLRYNYRTTLSLSKALRISPLRFFSKPSQIQWLIKKFQRTIILGCESHDCELWLTPNHQDNFCMNTWSCRKWGEHCWASREDWDVITFLCLCGSDHVYHELSLSFLICEMGALMVALLEVCKGGNQLSFAFLQWLAESGIVKEASVCMLESMTTTLVSTAS